MSLKNGLIYKYGTLFLIMPMVELMHFCTSSIVKGKIF